MKHNYYTKAKDALYQVHGHKKETLKDSLKAFDVLNKNIQADYYGTGEIIKEFEEKIAEYFGKEDCAFFPTASMAHQAALRIYSKEKNNFKIAAHPQSNTVYSDEESLGLLHNIEIIKLSQDDAYPNTQDVDNLPEVSTVLLDLPIRKLGGLCPKYEELKQMCLYAKERNFFLHLDGWALLETLPFFEKNPKEIAELFDSIYISFYNTIGAISGGMLISNSDFITKAKNMRRLLGGDIIRQYPQIVSAKYCFELRENRMKNYYEYAKNFAQKLNSLNSVVTVPEIPNSNMFHVYFDLPAGDMLDILEKVLQRYNFAFFRKEIKNIDENIDEDAYQFSYEDCKGSKVEIWFGDNYQMLSKQQINSALEYFEYELNKRLERIKKYAK